MAVHLRGRRAKQRFSSSVPSTQIAGPNQPTAWPCGILHRTRARATCSARLPSNPKRPSEATPKQPNKLKRKTHAPTTYTQPTSITTSPPPVCVKGQAKACWPALHALAALYKETPQRSSTPAQTPPRTRHCTMLQHTARPGQLGKASSSIHPHPANPQCHARRT